MFSQRTWCQSVRKKNKCISRISSFSRSSHQGCSAKKGVLKTLQYSQENSCISGLQFYLKETPTLMLSCEYCETFKDTYFEEYLRTAASYFMQKKNFSSKKFLNQWKSKGFQFWRLTFLQRKIQRKYITNLNKCQVENCLALPGRNLISTCNRGVKSVGLKFHPGKPGSCNPHLRRSIFLC